MPILEPTRRDFARATLTTTALSYSRILGANEKVNFGLIGAGGRGKGVMGTFQKTGRVNVTSVCDVYDARIDQAQTQAPGAKGFKEHRKLLESKDVDVVLIATPAQTLGLLRQIAV